MNGNKKLWAEYVDLWFDKTGKTKGIRFGVEKNTPEDRLHSAILSNVNYSSNVYGNNSLNANARFVSGAQN